MKSRELKKIMRHTQAVARMAGIYGKLEINPRIASIERNDLAPRLKSLMAGVGMTGTGWRALWPPGMGLWRGKKAVQHSERNWLFL